MKPVIIEAYLKGLRLAAEVYIAVSCFKLLDKVTHDPILAFWASAILLGLGQLIGALRQLGTGWTKRLFYGALHWLILMIVEAFSAFVILKQNELALASMFKHFSEQEIYDGLFCLLIVFELAVQILPEQLAERPAAWLDISVIVQPKKSFELPFRLEGAGTVEVGCQLSVSGGSGNDIDAVLFRGDGSAQVVMGRVSRRGQWTGMLASGVYALRLGNEFSRISRKVVRVRLTRTIASKATPMVPRSARLLKRAG